MLCSELMTTDVKTCGMGDPVSVAARIMRDENIGFVPISDESRRPLGVLTDRDITVRVVAEQLPDDTRCEQAMTKDVFTIRSDRDLLEAHQLMLENRIQRVLCVDEDGCLEGVISLSDLAAVTDDKAAAETMRTIADRDLSP